jgi:putative ABC transport system permease protein
MAMGAVTGGAGRGVPLARRLLGAHPLRVLAGAGGIGLALMLILLLDGLWAGVRGQATLFEDHTGAQLVVVAPGTDSLFADPSVLPAAAVSRVAATPGVDWVAPVRTAYAILDLRGQRAAVALVGATPGQPGGPWKLSSGRAPLADDEIALDRLFAARQQVRIGDRLPVLGAQLRVVGFTGESAMFMTPLVFVTERTAAGLLGAPDTTGVVLLGTADPPGVSTRLRAAGLTVRTPGELHGAALRLATRVFGGPLQLMVAVAFIAGTLIVALVAHTVITEQRRDLGVLKALGASGPRLARVGITETAALTAAGALAGVALLALGRVVIAAWRPQFPVLVTPGSLTRAAAAAAVMALLAAALPARRLARLDPAGAFRSGP